MADLTFQYYQVPDVSLNLGDTITVTVDGVTHTFQVVTIQSTTTVQSSGTSTTVNVSTNQLT